MSLRRSIMFASLAAAGCTPLIGVNSEEWDAIRLWLTCEECTDAHLQVVENIGSRATSVLEVFMRDSLPPDRRANMRRRIMADWWELQGVGVTMDSLLYLEHHTSNLTAVTQKRTAVALAALGEWDILRVAADSAEVRRYRDDVVAQVLDVMYADPLSRDTTVIARNGAIVGVVSIAGLPQDGITVTLESCGQGNIAFSPARLGICQPGPGGWGFTTSTGTDAGGGYSFTGLREGVYQVSVPDAGALGLTGPTPFSRICVVVGDSDVERADFPLTR